MAGLRVGFGFETAALDPARELNLAGIRIADVPGLKADGDGDVACRALLDAILAAASMPDLRTIFPGDDPELAECASSLRAWSTSACGFCSPPA